MKKAAIFLLLILSPVFIQAQDSFSGATISAGKTDAATGASAADAGNWWEKADTPSTGASPAVSATPGFRRSLGVYIYGNTGDLNKDAKGIYDGNEIELGIDYSQNFTKATWLTLGVKIDASQSFNWERNPGRGTLKPNTGSMGAFTPILRGYLIFGSYFKIDMRSDGFFTMNAFYTANVARGHFLTVAAGAELNYLDINGSEYHAGIVYETHFAKYLIFNSLFGARFRGADATTVRDTFHLRWDNTLGFKVKGATLWARIRYQPDQFLKPNARTLHTVEFHGGVAYNFDFSAL